MWIVEDDPSVAAVAVELCEASGAAPSVFRETVPFLAGLRGGVGPDVVVLDWRLERDLTAGIFLAVRNRDASLPVIYWTAADLNALPDVIHADPWTAVVAKGSGMAAFERAIGWALAARRRR